MVAHFTHEPKTGLDEISDKKVRKNRRRQPRNRDNQRIFTLIQNKKISIFSVMELL